MDTDGSFYPLNNIARSIHPNHTQKSTQAPFKHLHNFFQWYNWNQINPLSTRRPIQITTHPDQSNKQTGHQTNQINHFSTTRFPPSNLYLFAQPLPTHKVLLCGNFDIDHDQNCPKRNKPKQITKPDLFVQFHHTTTSGEFYHIATLVFNRHNTDSNTFLWMNDW